MQMTQLMRVNERNRDFSPFNRLARAADGFRHQNFTNNLLGCTRNAAANLRIFSSERLRSPRSTSAK
jgi:hypothetical protein